MASYIFFTPGKKDESIRGLCARSLCLDAFTTVRKSKEVKDPAFTWYYQCLPYRGGAESSRRATDGPARIQPRHLLQNIQVIQQAHIHVM